jgi:hypothetical protein
MGNDALDPGETQLSQRTQVREVSSFLKKGKGKRACSAGVARAQGRGGGISVSIMLRLESTRPLAQ